MSEYVNELDCGIMIGVGAAFDINAGLQKDAPNWMKEIGLQWFLGYAKNQEDYGKDI